jgi:hypothetical protein
VKAFIIKIQRSSVWWAFDVAVFPLYASHAIRHFINVGELVCNSHPFFHSGNCDIYRLQYYPNGFAGLTMYCIVFLPTLEYPKMEMIPQWQDT